MCKTFFLTFIFGFAFGHCNAQQVDKLVEKYTATAKYSEFYIILLAPAIPDENRKIIASKSVRKLNELTYIIEKFYLNSIENTFISNRFPANNEWKLSPYLQKLKELNTDRNKPIHLLIQLKDTTFLAKFYKINPEMNSNTFLLNDQKIISIHASLKQLEEFFINDESVTAIDVIQNPKEELGVPGFDLSANKLNMVHHLFPGINGANTHVSIKEENFDTSDIDLRGRIIQSPLASSHVSNHANFMATIIAGGGNSIWYAKGAAWGASVSSSSFANLLPDSANYYLQQKITVQNHSYGTLIDNNYGLSAVAFDQNAHSNQNLLHVFSSGNSGTLTSTTGTYQGVNNFANITGNFKMAKNAIVVGGVDSLGKIAPESSRGPAYDGRIKPDIVAFQVNGTSESAALVSGTALLLQQYYQTKHNDSLMPSALLKAVLINTADDINTPGPDFATGFGNLNALKAMQIIQKDLQFSGIISENEIKSFTISVPKNIQSLNVTLVWNDATALTFSPKALVNDLDLEVKNVQSNKITLPWILNTFPNEDSLKLKAFKGRDSINNVEKVTIENPKEGNYQIIIKGHSLSTSSQNFHVVFSYDSLFSFQWIRPTQEDVIVAGKQNIIRWESSIAGTSDFEYSLPPYENWKPISNNINLTSKFLYWDTPDTISTAILRMKTGNVFYFSDTILISKFAEPHTGFICGDSLLLYWRKISGINSYEIYTLGEKYLKPSFITSDTSKVVDKNSFFGKFISVAPILPSGLRGIKSYAFDYTLQGAGCYINSFLVYKQGQQAILSLNLGTTYLVDSILFESLSESGFKPLSKQVSNSGLVYNYNFSPLVKGITTFRVGIKLKSGQIIYTQPQSVSYVPEGEYLFAPNPVMRGANLSLYSSLPDGEILSIFDATGRRVIFQEIQSVREEIFIGKLQAGFYFYTIAKAGKMVTTGKLIIVN